MQRVIEVNILMPHWHCNQIVNYSIHILIESLYKRSVSCQISFHVSQQKTNNLFPSCHLSVEKSFLPLCVISRLTYKILHSNRWFLSFGSNNCFCNLIICCLSCNFYTFSICKKCVFSLYFLVKSMRLMNSRNHNKRVVNANHIHCRVQIDIIRWILHLIN